MRVQSHPERGVLGTYIHCCIVGKEGSQAGKPGPVHLLLLQEIKDLRLRNQYRFTGRRVLAAVATLFVVAACLLQFCPRSGGVVLGPAEHDSTLCRMGFS